MSWTLPILILVLKELGEPSEDLVREIILSLGGSKATPVGYITADMPKSAVNIHLPFITKIISFSFESSRFPDELKLAKASPIFKKINDLEKENYWPVSILSHVSKIFERILYMQIVEAATGGVL